jgi:hypothetical protein
MKPIMGEILKSILDGEEYVIKKIVQNTAMHESHNGRKQIIIEVSNLRLFYRKREKLRFE